MPDYTDRLTSQHLAPEDPALDNAPLARIIALETCAEMLAALKPHELAVVALRLDGIPFNTAGAILGLTKQATQWRMKTARQRLLQRFPHIETLVEL
jgi:DNA-directed RNA polymerase specialized sigma24 family protein